MIEWDVSKDVYNNEVTLDNMQNQFNSLIATSHSLEQHNFKLVDGDLNTTQRDNPYGQGDPGTATLHPFIDSFINNFWDIQSRNSGRYAKVWGF
ncbi:hypothetical protein [Spiroplasma endosymbiont of Labia minor]|uniref:hypothetical protein n=1 Tax=Spiroplasma endosymbiont of Labia minor TaxID=3066305 RepID=UPI0030D4638F